VKASDKKRLRAMEEEAAACYFDRYYGEPLQGDQQTPEDEAIRKNLYDYVDSQQANVKVPTYYLYWEPEETRVWMWIVMYDPVAVALLHKLLRAERDLIDGKRRMKRVGDGSHEPVEGDSINSAEFRARASAAVDMAIDAS